MIPDIVVSEDEACERTRKWAERPTLGLTAPPGFDDGPDVADVGVMFMFVAQVLASAFY
jgi:hypothetical protein